jgi:hypothetical protein
VPVPPGFEFFFGVGGFHSFSHRLVITLDRSFPSDLAWQSGGIIYAPYKSKAFLLLSIELLCKPFMSTAYFAALFRVLNIPVSSNA